MDKGVASDEARAATASQPSQQAVSGIAGIANAYRRFIKWLGPFGMLFVGMLLLMVGAAGAQPTMVVCLIGGLIVLSAYETHAENARATVKAHWANFFADMIADDRYASISVNHTWESMRPHLDAKIEELVAKAMSARQSHDPQGHGPKDASAVPEGDLPKKDHHHDQR